MRTILMALISAMCLCCQKEVKYPSVLGRWLLNEDEYNFQEKLTINSDGESDVFDYYISNDTIHLSYGLPFKIEAIGNNQMILSKRDSCVFIIYRFLRIE